MERRLSSQLLLCSMLVLALALPGQVLAQDEPDDEVKVIQPQGTKPGVVKREKPETPSEDTGSGGTGGGTATDAEAAGDDQTTGFDFGEDIDIDDNFGDTFDFTPTPSNTRFTVDFRDADLTDVVKLMSAQTGKNFIIADSLRAGKKITIISPNPVSQGEAYQAFLSALEMNGLTVVQSGKFYKIVDINRGLKEPIDPLVPGQSVPTQDALVTQIIELKHVEISRIKPVLDQLKTATGVIVEYPPTNTLIVTDTGNSIRRLLKVIDRLDSSSADAEKIWIYQVQYAEATEISNLLTQVFQQSGGGNNKAAAAAQTAVPVNAESAVIISQIVADERTNKLIIVADERSYERIKKLILKLDVELPDSGRINVVHLQNSDATEMAQVLSELSTTLKPEDPRRAAQAGQQQQGAAGGALLQGEVSVVANEATNDLIIVASPRDFLSLKSVIKELDRARKQVFVEAAILEVSIDRTRSLGIVLHGGDVFETGDGDGYLVGRTELNGKQSLSAGSLFLGSGSAPGLLAALIGPTLDLGPLEVPAFSVLLNALQANTDVNVLSTPTILTLDNEEAEISVGERIPFITSSGMGGLNTNMLSSTLGANSELAGAASLLSGYGGYGGTQITRVDVALTLKIKPQINEAGQVRLEIQEEIEEVKPGGSDLGGPTTRRRNLKTVVIVNDQETVV
ncbi:MAG: type II secretion system secretin GspD, partial [Myxococcota bacterium]|nr:type II secretion system secretin GspD [Myxococcota bacterium]